MKSKLLMQESGYHCEGIENLRRNDTKLISVDVRPSEPLLARPKLIGASNPDRLSVRTKHEGGSPRRVSFGVVALHSPLRIEERLERGRRR
jgi:hypothetical protein